MIGKPAFGLELGALADWPSSAHCHLSSDSPRAGHGQASKIIEAFTHADEGRSGRTQRRTVSAFFEASAATLVAITPTIALSDRILTPFHPVSENRR